MKQIIHFPNLRKIIFFFKLIGLPITKNVGNCYFLCQHIQPWKKERSEQPQEKQHNGKAGGEGHGPLFTSENSLCCGPQTPGKSDRGTSGQTKPEGRDGLGLHIGDLGLKQGTKPFVHFPKKNYE